MNDYIEMMERTLSVWMKEYPIEWIELAYKNTVGEPTIQECQAESDKIDAAFHDGYNHGYAQARFDYEQEPRKGHWIRLENWLDVGKRVECSACGQVFVIGDNVSRNFCANCGADMREVEE